MLGTGFSVSMLRTIEIEQDIIIEVAESETPRIYAPPMSTDYLDVFDLSYPSVAEEKTLLRYTIVNRGHDCALIYGQLLTEEEEELDYWQEEICYMGSIFKELHLGNLIGDFHGILRIGYVTEE